MGSQQIFARADRREVKSQVIYTVTMNPSMDYVMLFKKVAIGELNRSSREMHLPGGKGINVSIVLKNLGTQTTCLGFLAGYVGREIRQRMEDMGCDTDFIMLEEGCTRINVKVNEASGRESEMNGSGPRINEKCLEELEGKLSGLGAGDTLVLSGNVPGGVPSDIYGRLAAAVQGKGVTLVVDAEKSLLFPALPYHPFLIKPNREELSAMVGRKLKTREEIVKGSQQLQQMGACNILVSLGKEGAFFLSDQGEELWIDAPRGTVIQTVGSGDSMVAGFLSSQERGWSLCQSACYAVAAGSAGAFSECLPKRDKTDQLYQRMRAGEV